MQETQASMFQPIPIGAPLTASKKAFAELVGVTPGRVSQLIKSGLPVEPNGRIHIARGKAWMAENIDPNRRRASLDDKPAEPIAFTSPRAARDAAEARISTLKADRLAGLVISRKATLRAIEARAKMEADALLGWINRAAVAVASETGADIGAVTAILDREVREHLNAMAGTKLELPQ
jgi:hypothetical protein